MIYPIEELNVYISEIDVVNAIIDSRRNRLNSQNPRFKVLLPRATFAFIWLLMMLFSSTTFLFTFIGLLLNLNDSFKVVYSLLILIICIFFIPFITSLVDFLNKRSIHNKNLLFLLKEPIEEIEIENFFLARRSRFISAYEKHLQDINEKIILIEKSQGTHTVNEKVKILRNRISMSLARLDNVKYHYFDKLDQVELSMKKKLINLDDHTEIQEIVDAEIALKNLDGEIETIHYYLEAVLSLDNL